MQSVSVSEAAKRLGVGVPRVHQRIADGSLRADRVGSQWVIDERSLVQASERHAAGRPLSARSAWALIALSADNPQGVLPLASVERRRARARLAHLAGQANRSLIDEEHMRRQASLLRSWFRNRADRKLYRVSPVDLADLRADTRLVLSGLSVSKDIADGGVVEAYAPKELLEQIEDDYLMVLASEEANVILHVAPSQWLPFAGSPLAVAADLAEQHSPREERRAAELVEELAARDVNGLFAWA